MNPEPIRVEVDHFMEMDDLNNNLTNAGVLTDYSIDDDGVNILITLPNGIILHLCQP